MSSSAFTSSPSPGPRSTRNPGSISIVSEVNESYQSLPSPSSAEVSSSMVSNIHMMDHFDNACGEDFSKSNDVEVRKALKRLEEQLSLNDDTIVELEPFFLEDEQSNSTGFQDYEAEISTKSQYGNLLDGSGYSVNYQFPYESNGVQDSMASYVDLQETGIVFLFLPICGY